MKILNLDKLAKGEKRQLLIDGKTYPVDQMTVGNFIETTRAAEAIKNEDSLVNQIEQTVEMILRSVPTIERPVLQKRSLTELQFIVAFVRGDDIDGVEQGEEDAEGK